MLATAVGAALLLVALSGTGLIGRYDALTVLFVIACATVPPITLIQLSHRFKGSSAWRSDLTWVTDLRDGVELLGRSPKHLCRASLWYVAAVGCAAARLVLIYGAFGASVSTWAALFIAAAGALSMLVAITPGGLGIREGAIAVAGVLFEVPTDTGLLVATVDRGILLCATLLIGGPSLLWITRELAGRQAVGQAADAPAEAA